MRLLQRSDNGKLSLTKDLAGNNIPPYAILSHTWGPDTEEVTFKDLLDGTAEHKVGYRKLEFCIEQAKRNDIQYCWVDTCCIDKSNADELQASINSMFRWYRDAARCFVYLSDVSITGSLSQDGSKSKPSWKEAFEKSRWFTRGWTLQELLAPASVQFFSNEGKLLGDKGFLEPEIHSITKIPTPALRKGAPFDQFDVDERLRWATKRQTTREEDWAYSLLGIFGVFMPLLYGEGKDNAVRRLRKEIDNTPKRQDWLRKLYACPYRDRKDRNPPRVEGTCGWFTSHQLFRNWQQSGAASLLWVSADPGCGKSVLAKYLVDEVLPSTTTRTTCYFFFKEDFEDQRSSVAALCSILYQIFDQRPASFSTQILETLEDKGDMLLTSFGDLWGILISTATGHKRGEIVCILDALDECEISGRCQLIEAISKFYSSTMTTHPALKLILTSRPYVDIQRGFYPLERDLPTIHLSGENEEEINKISREIDLVVGSRVADVGGRLRLLQEEQHVLREELTRAPNRTYLWVHLIFDIITNSIIDGIEDISSIVKTIPKTVDTAYNRILSKSPDVKQARKLLHIVAAATRPLTLQEIALALAIKPHHQSIADLKLGPEDRIRHNIRQLCGLFVVVVDSKVYLLHQTAREFLVPPPSGSSPPLSSSTALQWKFSLHPKESHRILAEICIRRLSLLDFNLSGLRASVDRDQYIDMRTFLQYAAQYWADHFREANWNGEDWAVEKAISYCRPDLPTSAWFDIYQRVATRNVPGNFTPLLVASYFGLSSVVERLPKKVLKDVNVKDTRHGRSAISWAAGEGYGAVVQRLLRGGAVRRLLGAGARVNAKDKYGMTPLHWASENGYNAVVQRLLNAGADVNARGNDSGTPLHRASADGHDAVVQRLLDAGANANARNNYNGMTPLQWASVNGYDAVVQRLLNAGADTNVRDEDGRTPLHKASENGHDAVVQRLFDAGANTNARDKDGRTPLHEASENGHDAVVQRLLNAGTDTNARDNNGRTPLHEASENGHNAVVQWLLDAGADANARNNYSGIPLHEASENGHDAVVQRLLNAGADTNARDNDGRTPLHKASENGHNAVVQWLLDAGADANARNNYSGTPLHEASENGHDAVVQRLLDAGADVNARDNNSGTPLHWASANNHNTVVQRLLDAGADTNAKDKYGMTPLLYASRNGHDAVVQRLLDAGADANTRNNYNGITPLQWASRKGHVAVVQRLLNAGANVNARDNNSGTPLYWASVNGHNAVVQWLLGAGANTNTRDKDSRTPLHEASKNGYNAVVQWLLNANANTNAKDKYGMTPLHWASQNSHNAVVQQLLDAGANVNARDNDSGTPLYWASVNGHDAVVQRLLDAGADTNARDKDGRTPLHEASENGHNAVVQRLLDAGADANARNNYSGTPLHWASRKGHDAVVQRLLNAGAKYSDKL